MLTNDAQAAYDIARKVRTGVVGQNGMRMEWTAPFGGFKQSGIGREGGEEGMWRLCRDQDDIDRCERDSLKAG